MKRSFLTSLITSLIFVLSIVVIGWSQQPVRRVVVLSTNDVHGAIQQFPRLATAIAECRDTAEVVLVDA
ncbi:MAG: bifunctional metallophosphatase/5'-nucleotidase, partial [Rikenellaceae bacterium]|nr:bifunctional metallophosphatase/5'-nucleotidase [Rikenellaceae bacterium]